MLDDDILSRHWFVMQAAPSREHDAAKILRGRGYQVYQPVELRKHRPNRHAKRRWWYSMPIFSRYMLLGSIAPTPPWFDLLEFTAIAQVVDYRPVRRKAVLELFLAHGLDGLQPPRLRRYRTSTEEITEGAEVLILAGPYAAHKGKVASIIGKKTPRATISLPVFGGRPIELPLEDLELELEQAA